MEERRDRYEECREEIINCLRSLGERQKHPDLLDRIALPVDIHLTSRLARFCDIPDDQIKSYINEGGVPANSTPVSK